MPSIFNPTDNQKIIDRINKLTPDSERQWGKMTVSQMLSHCIAPIDVLLGNSKIKANFIFQLLGRLIKRKIINAPELSKNNPTAPEFIRKENYDFDKTKIELIEKLQQFQDGTKVIKTNRHPFFGPMSSQDWDTLQWKHLDHHLRQFGV
ncbi:DUF1569 domain-containing protein [Flavobacterium sp. H122]|uniref:DUF1569 domain-containing protein n=1 Tax=Flavobacterium sp. H122 TaxID=2529860 RepID=UPI0010AA5CC3|nr:DUF1569 domain-containing protein [Flavobacterium sp. H122]